MFAGQPGLPGSTVYQKPPTYPTSTYPGSPGNFCDYQKLFSNSIGHAYTFKYSKNNNSNISTRLVVDSIGWSRAHSPPFIDLLPKLGLIFFQSYDVQFRSTKTYFVTKHQNSIIQIILNMIFIKS